MLYTLKWLEDNRKYLKYLRDANGVEYGNELEFDTETGRILRQKTVDGKIVIDYDKGEVATEEFIAPLPFHFAVGDRPDSFYTEPPRMMGEDEVVDAKTVEG